VDIGARESIGGTVADAGDGAQVADTLCLGGLRPDGIVIYERLLPAVAGTVPRIRRELGAVLVPCALDARRRGDIALFLTEAASNAVRHAYAGEPGPLYVLAGVDGERLGVVISDSGCGFGSGAHDASDGFGLSLMTRLADAVSIASDGSGTDVEGSFAFAGAAGASGPSVDVRDARGQMLLEYLRVLEEMHDAVRQDTAAVIAEARQAVAHSRRRRLARQARGSSRSNSERITS
jgi:anti-sigma regulatory factor (Ser/Thr protein kinase)